MLAVISDLHFEEEASVVIKGPGGERIGRRRNLPAKPFLDFIARLAREAKANNAQRLDLVLAGDIFDIHRSGFWFDPEPGPMPYDREVGPALEAKVIQILNAIESQDEKTGDGVHQALAAFRKLATEGKFVDGGKEGAFPFGPDRIRIHYLTGNHDRLCNATGKIRERVREILGILSAPGERFPNQFQMSDPPVLVRHGHEYEYTNFSVDNSKRKEFPVELPAADYDAPTFGDLVTVQVASRLPFLFRRHHTDARICASPLLQHVYDRLIEFDDVRPQSALFDFVLNDPDIGSPAQAWDAVEPVLRTILGELSENAFLRECLKARDGWGPDRIDAVQAILDGKVWKLTRKLPRKLLQSVATMARAAEGMPPWDYAARETAIRDGSARLLIGGHTHNPIVQLAASDKEHGERYYVDTGTWRNQVPATPDGKRFGHVKSLTYVIVYGQDEDRPSRPDDPRNATASAAMPPMPDAGGAAAGRPEPRFSFDFWSGVTQRFGP